MEEESWETIWVHDKPTRYKASSLGRIISYFKGFGRVLNPTIRYRGYIVVQIYLEDGSIYRKSAHIIIANTFLPNPNNYRVVLHKNDIKDDNRVSNLEWGTDSKNTQDAYDRGLAHGRKGEKHHLAKLTNDLVLDIFHSKISVRDIAIKNGISEKSVYEIKSGQKWSHITGKVYCRKNITKEIAIEIYNSSLSCIELCTKYGMSDSAIYAIKNGTSWGSATKNQAAFPVAGG